MAKRKPSESKRDLQSRSAKTHNGKAADGSVAGRPSKRGRRSPVVPRADAELDRLDGIPDDAQIDEAVAGLDAEDRRCFQQVRSLLAEHLGSHAAARLWLVSQDTGFETTALDAIRKGQVKVVLATLESQWGPRPIYA